MAAAYDPDTLHLLNRAFDDAWSDVEALFGARIGDPENLRSALAKRIVRAAGEGERDLKRLKLIALEAIDA